MAAKLTPGKVYLRNTANGRVYEYEKNLAEMTGFERFVYEDGTSKPVPTAPKPVLLEPTPEGPKSEDRPGVTNVTDRAAAIAQANAEAEAEAASRKAAARAAAPPKPAAPKPAAPKPAAPKPAAPKPPAK